MPDLTSDPKPGDKIHTISYGLFTVVAYDPVDMSLCVRHIGSDFYNIPLAVWRQWQILASSENKKGW